MSRHDDEPLEFIWYSLDEALDLMDTLLEARRTLRVSRHLAGVVLLEEQIQTLRRKLELEEPDGDDGGG